VRSIGPDVDARLDALIASMLAANPTARPAAMRDLVAAIDGLDKPAPRPATPRRRKRVVALAIAGLATVLSVAAIRHDDDGHHDDPPARERPAPVATTPAPTLAPTVTPIDLPDASVPPPVDTSAPPPPVEAAPVRKAPRRRTPAEPTAPAKDVIIADPFQ